LAKQMSEGSLNSSGLALYKGGWTDGSTRSLQMRATPGHLRIHLPLPGTQCPGDGGFPLVAMSWQSFRIRGTLRKLEDLVVCSDTTVIKPAPWSLPSMKVSYDNGSSYPFTPLERTKIPNPVIVLSTVQHYVSPEIQEELRSKPIQIPFRRQFENKLTFGELDFIPLDKGGVAACTRFIDGRHPTERLFWFFRNYNALDRNQLDNWYNDYFDSNPTTMVQPYTTPYGEFYYRIKLNIAGKDREERYAPFVWNSINPLAKDEKSNDAHIGSMNWSTGEKYGTVYPAERQPEGTINWTTADRPTLHIELANINTNPLLGQRKAEFRVFTEGWNVYTVKDGRGKVMFAS